jgi:glycosyltransferase involved in cell wall biosynthesis
MRILFFGTYDERTHPRVRALREGLAQHGHEITTVNEPLGVSTAERVGTAKNPLRAPILALRIVRCWVRLWRRSAGLEPDVVVVGYLGHFDVHLARRRFRRAALVLDHMVSLGDTARDRGLSGRSAVSRLLDAIDRAALRTADVTVVDTEEQAAALPEPPRCLVVVPVTPPAAWASVEPAPDRWPGQPLKVVFFGLFTPLQGAPTIGEAVGMLADRSDVQVTMVGTGQDLQVVRRRAAPNRHVQWIDWVGAEALPDLVADHHVCLGIFGTTPKAGRVVPNKVLQGGAAGCAIVTSDTPVQRRLLGDSACYVPAGDAAALASVIRRLADDTAELTDRRRRMTRRMHHDLTPKHAAEPLDRALRFEAGRADTA